MDLTQVIIRLHPNAKFRITNDDYNKLKWHESNTESKPTLEECEAAWQEIINEAPLKKLREQRDEILKQTDQYGLADYPFNSEEIKQTWFTYRQQLRDLPQNSLNISLNEQNELVGVEWPTPPE
jgi:hypothetical protein